MLTKRDYQDAIDVQDACNLSGVVHSFDKIVSRIWDEAREKGLGTDYVNRHPIVVMFVSKLASLSGGDSMENFRLAYEACQVLAWGGPPEVANG
jgi:hypothetical protein